MKTRDLINVLVADRTAISPRPVFAVAIAVGVGTVISAALLVSSIGIRPDIASAALSPRFLAKFAIALSLAVGAVGLTTRLSRPEASAGPWIWMLGAVPLFLTLAVAVELILAPASQWEARLFGAHWLACLASHSAVCIARIGRASHRIEARSPPRWRPCWRDCRSCRRRHCRGRLCAPLSGR